MYQSDPDLRDRQAAVEWRRLTEVSATPGLFPIRICPRQMHHQG